MLNWIDETSDSLSWRKSMNWYKYKEEKNYVKLNRRNKWLSNQVDYEMIQI